MPIPSWNDVFANGDDWSNIAFQQLFWDAIYERESVVALGTLASRRVLTHSDDVQGVGYITSLQIWPLNIVARFFDPSVWPGRANITVAAMNTTYTAASLRTNAGVNASGYRRKRPREISSLGATTDTMGNTIHVGDLARYTADGGWYSYNGSTWVISASPPDILDSNNGTVPYGLMQAGDLIGPWVWTEIRNMINKLYLVLYNGAFFDRTSQLWQYRQGTTHNPPGVGSQATWGAAQGAAATDFAGESTLNVPGATSGVSVYTDGTTNGVTYDADMQAMTWGIGGQITGLGYTYGTSGAHGPLTSCDMHFYGFWSEISDNNSTNTTAFDNNGILDDFGSTPIDNGPFTTFHSTDLYTLMRRDVGSSMSSFVNNISTTIGTFPAYADLGAITVPNWCASPVSPKKSWQGYAVRNPLLIANFKVTGGFAQV